MANLLAPKDDASSGSTEQPVSSGGGGTSTGGSGGTTSVNSGGTSGGPQGPAANTQADVNTIGSLNQGADFSPMVNYVKGQGDTAKGAINTEQSGFQTALGNAPTFGQEQQNTLKDVLSGKQGLDVGKGMLNTQYTGPQGVDRTHYDPQVGQYVTSANETGSEAGIGTLLGQLNPDLTPGERSYDALTYRQNPDFLAQSQNFMQDAGATQQLADTTAGNSYSAVGQRQADINAFNAAAKGFVGSQRDAINTAIAGQIAAGQQHNQAETDAIAALKAGTKSFSDYDPSMFGFNTSQYGPQNVTVDQSKYIEPGGTFSPGMQWAAQQMLSHGFPGGYPTPTSTALMAPYAFSQTVDPRQFLSYASTPLTRTTAATPEQALEYNNAEALLNENDTLTGTGGAGLPGISLNTNAYQQALAQAMAQRDVVAKQDQDWMSQWSAMPKQVGQGWTYQIPQGGIPVDANGKPLSPAALALAQAASRAPGMPNQAPTMQELMNMQGTAAGDAWYRGNYGAEGGGGPSSAGVDADAAEGAQSDSQFAAGGLITDYPNPDDPQSAASMLTSGGSTGGLGGAVSPSAGLPGVQDSVPIQANAGEYVMSKPATQSLGQDNLKALNMLSQKTPMQQAMAKQALQTALSKASISGADSTVPKLGSLGLSQQMRKPKKVSRGRSATA